MQFSTLLFAASASALALKDIPRAVGIYTTEDMFVGPLVSCSSPSAQFELNEVVLDPYPVVAGKPLTVRATGNLKAEVVQGSTVDITVKLGFINVFSKTIDLCEQASTAGKACPLAPGPQDITAAQNLPDTAPAGTYKLELKVKNADKAEIACLTGNVKIVKA